MSEYEKSADTLGQFVPSSTLVAAEITYLAEEFEIYKKEITGIEPFIDDTFKDPSLISFLFSLYPQNEDKRRQVVFANILFRKEASEKQNLRKFLNESSLSLSNVLFYTQSENILTNDFLRLKKKIASEGKNSLIAVYDLDAIQAAIVSNQQYEWDIINNLGMCSIKFRESLKAWSCGTIAIM